MNAAEKYCASNLLSDLVGLTANYYA